MTAAVPIARDRAEKPGTHPIAGALARLVACHDLPDTPPDDPMALLARWYAQAKDSGRYDDFNAMTLATATPDGAPSARIVLCKAIETDPPALVFYTSYLSRKGRELESNPRAAALFFWAHAKRQARIEGVVERVSAAESDAYFRTRPFLSRIGAAASCQSEPVESRAELLATAAREAGRAALAGGVERPEHWGGFRLHIRAVELWSAREGRLHDRVQWKRREGSTIAWTVRRVGP